MRIDCHGIISQARRALGLAFALGLVITFSPPVATADNNQAAPPQTAGVVAEQRYQPRSPANAPDDYLWRQYSQRGQAFRDCPRHAPPAASPSPAPKKRVAGKKTPRKQTAARKAPDNPYPCPPLILPIIITPEAKK